jgi:LysM repeat protein
MPPVMKAILLFATLSMVLAMPCESAQTELESLRQLCQDQDRKIRQLEGQLKQLGAGQASAATSPAKASEAARPTAIDTYPVKSGDSIEKIARRTGCTASVLYKLNGLKPSSIIHPGQRIKLPTGTGLAAADSRSQKSTPTAGAAEKPEEAAKVHRIKQGDTYSSLSRQYKIPVDRLIALNPKIKATALRPGISIRLNSGKPDTISQPEAGLATTGGKTKAPLAAPSTKTLAPNPKPAAPAASQDPVAKATTPAQAGSTKTETAKLPEAKTGNEIAGSTVGTGQAPASAPLRNENTPPTPQADPNSKVERRIRSVKIEEPMTYGEFAIQHGTDAERLNDLNGLDLTQATVLAKGSELYVPAQP